VDTCRKITYWIVLLICLWLPVSVQAPAIPYEPSLVIIQGNSIKAITPPTNFANIGALAVHSGLVDVIYPQELIRKKYPEIAEGLIKLAFCESSLKPNNKGDNNTSFGLFMFKETTWQENCEGNIWNIENQTNCAIKLIKKGEGKNRWRNCWIKENLDNYF